MDLSIPNFDLRVPGKTLIKDTNFHVASGEKYGLVGRNGAGKTTLLRKIHEECYANPSSKSCLLVEQEVQDLDMSVYEYVWQSNTRMCQLLQEVEDIENDSSSSIELDDQVDNQVDFRLQELYEELRTMEYEKQPSVLQRILYGLGFSQDTQQRPISSFSGGWRMRVALAKGLFLQPKLLLLDEPSNHLDIEATIWLTNYICELKSTVVIVSHDQALLNQVCTWIIHLNLDTQTLKYYKGDYRQFEKMAAQKCAENEKEWAKLQRRIKQLKTKKERQQMLEESKLEPPTKPYRPRINFGEAIELGTQHPLRLCDVAVGYEPQKVILSDVSISINEETRITVVGGNGSGKTTFLRLLVGKLDDKIASGELHRDPRLQVGFYDQHSTESLDKELTPIECILQANVEMQEFDARKALGSIGLAGNLHNSLINSLSGGQKARVAFCVVFAQNPHVILLDEATNHLDIETVNALIDAVNSFTGGVIMVTHDEKLVIETKSRLWVCRNSTVTPYNGDYNDYKEEILDHID